MRKERTVDALRFIVAAATVSGLLGISATGAAQRLGGQRFAPAISEDGVLGTEGADRRRQLVPYAAFWLHYALDPVTLSDADGDETAAIVEHLLAMDLIASMAVWEGLEFGFRIPVTLYSGGDDTAAAQAGVGEAPGTAFGDIVLQLGYRQRLGDHTALALHVPVLLPTTAEDDPLGLGFGVRPTLAFMHRFGPVELLLNLSYLFREDEQALDYDGGQELGARGALRIALDSLWRTGVLVDVGFSTATNDMFAAATSPAEGRLGLDHWIGDRVRIAGFLGTGFSTGVGAPDLRAGIGIAIGDNPSYRPRPNPTSGDEDGDGVPDETDQCRTEPEDPDEFQDEDGCPEEDNDRDGISDQEDDCPNAPETMNNISDEDGCPDLIRVEDTLITTFEPVYFKTDSDEILERSHPMLQEVANVMKVNPGLRVRVEGHTDSQGPSRHNLELSQQRAASVREFLVEQGVASDQVEAVGHGERRAVESNATAEGRSRNRRVEFHLLRGED